MYAIDDVQFYQQIKYKQVINEKSSPFFTYLLKLNFQYSCNTMFLIFQKETRNEWNAI